MSFRSHATIPLHSRRLPPFAAAMLAAIAAVAVASAGWLIYAASASPAPDQASAEIGDRNAAVQAALHIYQAGQRDAIEAIVQAQGITLDQACQLTGRGTGIGAQP